MPKLFEKGNPGKPKGAKNKRTLQWEAFSDYCLNGGLAKYQKELKKLEGEKYVNAFHNLLEFHKPKLARTELKHEGEITVKQSFTIGGKTIDF